MSPEPHERPKLPDTATIDAHGNLALPPALRRGGRITIACPPAWLAAGRFQLVDRDTLIALTRRIARMRTSGAMANAAALDAAYRLHAANCPIDPGTGTIRLPARLRGRFAPLPCTVSLTPRDGPITVKRID